MKLADVERILEEVRVERIRTVPYVVDGSVAMPAPRINGARDTATMDIVTGLIAKGA